MTPRLETARLVLTGHRPADLDDCFAMWSDPLVTRHIGGKPSTREEVWSRLLRYAGHWQLLGFGFWLIRDRATGQFVGEAGLANFERGLGPSFDGAPEMGWALAPHAHGKGLATEAVHAVLAWADATLEAKRLVCMIDPGNAPSLKLAAKAGFRALGPATYKGSETQLFERSRA